MSNKLFLDDEIEVLSRNKYVKSVSKRGITYSDEFKSIFVAEYDKGYLPTQIFHNAGFDINILGNDRIWSASKRWRKAYTKSGELGLRDTRKFNSGRSLNYGRNNSKKRC